MVLSALSPAVPPGQAAHLTGIRIPSGAVDVAFGRGAVWVSGFGRTVRLDPRTGRILASVSTPG